LGAIHAARANRFVTTAFYSDVKKKYLDIWGITVVPEFKGIWFVIGGGLLWVWFSLSPISGFFLIVTFCGIMAAP
jgi:hypothetical protein